MSQVHYRKQFTTSENDIHMLVEEGKTLREIVDGLQIPVGLEHSLRIYVDGELIENDSLDLIIPTTESKIKVLLIPQGDNQIVRMVAMMALVYAAGPAGTALAGGAGAAATAISIGITIVGALALNAVFAPPEAPEMGEVNGSAALTILGSKNSAKFDKPVQRIYGTVKNYPPFGAQPFTISHGGDQFLYMLFDLGYGNIDVSELKIGETSIDDFDDVDYNVIEGVSSGFDLDLFTNDIETEQINIELDLSNTIIKTSSTEQKYIQFDIAFNSGLYGINELGNPIIEDVTFSYVLKDAGGTPISPSNYTLANIAGLPAVEITQPTTSTFKLESKTEDGFTLSFTLKTTEVTDQLTLELTRSAESSNGVTTISNSFWTALRTFRLGAAIGDFRLTDPGSSTRISHTMIEMRIKASDQLSGVIDSFNCIAAGKLRTYIGGSPAFTSEIVTDNPAWIYADILTGMVNQRPKSDSKINWTEIKRWADFCDTLVIGEGNIESKAHTCNFVLDYSSTIFDLLREIAAIGRASPDIYDDMYSVIFEEEKTTKVQLFTNMNTSNFNSSRVYTVLPDAVKVNFRDPLSDWQMREHVIYNDNKSISNSKIFESIDSPKTTCSCEAYRNGRYWLKQAELRKETITFDTDIDWLECKRGSYVGFQHDIIKSGGTVARVRSIDGTNVVLDTLPTMNGNTVDSFELRPCDGSIISGFVAYYNAGDPYTVDLGISDATVGDLIVINSVGQQSYDLIVKSIDVNPDQTAKVTCVEYAPAIFDLASEAIPSYSPHIGVINRPNDVPQILESLIATETLILINKLSYVTISLDYQPAFGTVPATYYIFKQDEESVWVFQGSTIKTSFVWGEEILAIDNPIIGTQHNFAVVAVSDNGDYLNPVNGRQVSITPQGDTTIPPTPDSFTVEDTAENFRRFWWGYDVTDEPEDLAGFIIRYTRSSLQDWSAASPLHDGILLSPPFEIRALPQGA